jgi:hypothetical protein
MSGFLVTNNELLTPPGVVVLGPNRVMVITDAKVKGGTATSKRNSVLKDPPERLRSGILVIV